MKKQHDGWTTAEIAYVVLAMAFAAFLVYTICKCI